MKDNIHAPSCPWHGVDLDGPHVDEMDGTPCTCRAQVKQDYTLRLEFPNGDGRSWPIKDSYFDRRWHGLGLKVHKTIIDHDKECGFRLEQTDKEAALDIILEAAAIRLDQWVNAIEHDGPTSNVIDEIWEAHPDERQEIADRLAAALDKVQEGRS